MDVQRLQVLVVAADPAVLAAVSETLTQANVGADLLHAEDAAGALGFLHPGEAAEEAASPDVVLLDADLVAELLEPLGEDPDFARLPVVVLAGDADAAARELGGRRIHDVLAKPPASEDLLRILSYFDEA